MFEGFISRVNVVVTQASGYRPYSFEYRSYRRIEVYNIQVVGKNGSGHFNNSSSSKESVARI